ncbi:MAG: MotA/TolQ/ExbB proton channel family protein [Bdellovibrionota bacterium]|nr:MAG: MotA/TolQ/ExbB proton channel family protein [Bdellovibrionota bacterium]
MKLNKRIRRPISLRHSRIDPAVMLGLGCVGMLLAIGALGSAVPSSYFDPLSLLLVLGGTLGATLTQCSSRDLLFTWRSLQQGFALPSSPVERANAMLRLAADTRRSGVLVLEQHSQAVRDRFLRLGLELTADGTKAEEIGRVLENELRCSEEQDSRAVTVLETMGTYAPAMGLIGTLLGLIQMLQLLDKPTQLGPAMGLALVTTLYGAMLANCVCLPLAGKLRSRMKEQALIKRITIEGMQSIARNENALALEQKLQSFFPKMVA